MVAVVHPALSSNENKWLTGIWVRDSSAGIGTLTFTAQNTVWRQDSVTVYAILIPKADTA